MNFFQKFWVKTRDNAETDIEQGLHAAGGFLQHTLSTLAHDPKLIAVLEQGILPLVQTVATGLLSGGLGALPALETVAATTVAGLVKAAAPQATQDVVDIVKGEVMLRAKAMANLASPAPALASPPPAAAAPPAPPAASEK
jgi:hypothetical protein